MNDDDIKLRSEEVQEILTRIPHWMIRWGNFIILLILLLLLTMSWIIKYPDLVTSEIIITTATPPQKIVARTGGRLEKILVRNGQLVTEGTALAIIENTADYQDVFKLQQLINNVNIQDSNIKFPFEQMRNLKLGDIEVAFGVFERDYTSYQLNADLHPHSIESTAQNNEILQLRQRLSYLLDQQKISNSEIKIKKNELERFRKLHDKGVIATQEWESKELDYLRFEKELRNLSTSISQIKSSLIQIDRDAKTTTVNETRDHVTLYKSVLQSFSQLKKAIFDWEMAYVLRSNTKGNITFLEIWQNNQTVEPGENVFTVVPRDSGNYIGKIKAVSQNAGKIKVGQLVNIHLANYPDKEFGILRGKVSHISLLPDKDGKLIIDVTLPATLVTTYRRKLIFQQEMIGSADIITEDLRLIERLLYQFRDLSNVAPQKL